MTRRGSAFLFGGQGDERRAFEGALPLGPHQRRLVQAASDVLGTDLARALEGRAPALFRTELAQPLLVALLLGEAAELEAAGIRPALVAGHSLGEVAAYSCAGCFDAETAVRLACARGAAMGRAAGGGRGAMIAVTARSVRDVDAVLADAGEHGVIGVAARNSDAQWVLTGDVAAVERAAALVPATRLVTDGAWHSLLMEAARAEWLEALRAAEIRPPSRPLLTNRTGGAVSAGDDVAALLADQLTGPIRWLEATRAIAGSGVGEVVVVGPSRAVRGLCREALGERVAVVTGAALLRPARAS